MKSDSLTCPAQLMAYAHGDARGERLESHVQVARGVSASPVQVARGLSATFGLRLYFSCLAGCNSPSRPPQG